MSFEFEEEIPFDHPVARMAREMALKAEAVMEAQMLAEKHSSVMENEVLMDLWSKLGDQTETYWQAFRSAESYCRVSKVLQKELTGYPLATSLILCDAVIQLLEHQKTTLRTVAELTDKYQKKKEQA